MTRHDGHIDRRFERLGRLISEDGVHALGRAHVAVCGMGGVGSWAAEALARSGIGRLTLVDFDKVTITTINRQLPGMESTLGRAKVDVIAERARAINPAIEVTPREARVNRDSVGELFADRPDFVIDAIDQLGNKCALIAHCVKSDIRIVVSTGAGGRLDPTRIQTADLAQTSMDPLAQMAREYLRRKHDFPRQGPFGVPAVYSTERHRHPLTPIHPEADLGRVEIRAAGGDDTPLRSDHRNVIMGTACFVTSVFGMTCASVVVRELLRCRGFDVSEPKP